MEIHSSSLSFISTGYKTEDKKEQKQIVDRHVKTGIESKQDILIQHPENNSVQTFKIANVVNLSNDIEKQTISPNNSHAINAYIHENIQSLKQQQSELLPKIDFFI